MDRSRDEQGQYADRIPPEAMMEVFDAREDVARPITAKDVTEALGISRRTAHNKLNELVERGELDTRKVGARGRVWWIPVPRKALDRAAPRDAPARHEAPAKERADRTVASAAEPARETTRTPVQDASRDALAEVEFPGSRDREACEAAVLAARAYLREHGPATMRELVADVMPTHPVGYNVPELEPGERYRGGWWRLVVKPGLEALPDVEAPPRGASDWRYTGAGDSTVSGGSEVQDADRVQERHD